MDQKRFSLSPCCFSDTATSLGGDIHAQGGGERGEGAEQVPGRSIYTQTLVSPQQIMGFYFSKWEAVLRSDK